MSTVAVAVRKLLVSRCEDAFGFFSDLYKDVYGFRPRGHFTNEDIANDPKGTLRRLDAAIESLSQELREQLDRERAEREVFNAKVSDLGLDPAKFSRLFEYADE